MQTFHGNSSFLPPVQGNNFLTFLLKIHKKLKSELKLISYLQYCILLTFLFLWYLRLPIYRQPLITSTSSILSINKRTHFSFRGGRRKPSYESCKILREAQFFFSSFHPPCLHLYRVTLNTWIEIFWWNTHVGSTNIFKILPRYSFLCTNK